MNRVTKAERDKMVQYAQSIIVDSNTPIWQGVPSFVSKQLVKEFGISTDRANRYAAKAIRLLRAKEV